MTHARDLTSADAVTDTEDRTLENRTRLMTSHRERVLQRMAKGSGNQRRVERPVRIGKIP